MPPPAGTVRHLVVAMVENGAWPGLEALGSRYATCANWFASVPAAELPNRSFAHAATSIGRLDMNPLWFNQGRTIYELLAESNVGSRIYFDRMTMAMTFRNLLHASRFFAPMDDFFDACSRDALPAYSFVEPVDTPVHEIVAAIRNHPTVWMSTLLLIVEDCSAGPSEESPRTVNPDGKLFGDPFFDFTQLGSRVRAVAISPWIDAETVDSTQYDHASIPATARKLFLGKNWEMDYLTARDHIAEPFDRNLTRDSPRTDFVEVSNESPARPNGPVSETMQPNGPLSEMDTIRIQQAHFVNQSLAPELRSKIHGDDIQTRAEAAAFFADVLGRVLPRRVRTAPA